MCNCSCITWKSTFEELNTKAWHTTLWNLNLLIVTSTFQKVTIQFYNGLHISKHIENGIM